MPLYEFKCEDCGRVDEIICSYPDSKFSRECNQCGGVMSRQMSACGCRVYRYDLDYAGTPAHAEAHARRCGVEV